MRLGQGSVQALTDEKLEEAISTLMKERERRQKPQCPGMIEAPDWEPLIALTAELIEESMQFRPLPSAAGRRLLENP